MNQNLIFIDGLWSPAGKGPTSWLWSVMSNCEVVTFTLLTWVRCGACLYRFLIFVPFLTLKYLKLNELLNEINLDNIVKVQNIMPEMPLFSDWYVISQCLWLPAMSAT